MAVKLGKIKVDLELGDVRIKSLEELRQYGSVALLKALRDGRLEKFLESRKCYEELAKLQKLFEELGHEEVRILKSVYEVLKIDKPVSLEELVEMYAQPEVPEAVNENDSQLESSQEGEVSASPTDLLPVKSKRPRASRFSLKVPNGFHVAKDSGPEPYTETGWAKEIIHDFTGMSLLYIPAGSFMMGSLESEPLRKPDEVQHKVILTKGFYLGKYEVMRGEWREIMGSCPCGDFPKYLQLWREWRDNGEKINIDNYDGESIKTNQCVGRDTLPACKISWNAAFTFCQGMGDGFHLPTESEWEYACRAGRSGSFSGRVDNMEYYLKYCYTYKSENYQQSIPIPSRYNNRQANPWGLYHMHGNVAEWCQDWYGPYPTTDVTDPVGPDKGDTKVYRGGDFNSPPSPENIASGNSWSANCRSASRRYEEPTVELQHIGLRVAFSPDEAQYHEAEEDKTAKISTQP